MRRKKRKIPSKDEKKRLILEAFPGLSEEEAEHAMDVVDEYLRIGWQIYLKHLRKKGQSTDEPSTPAL